MLPSTRRCALLYVSDRTDRTDVFAGLSADRISTRPTSALAGDTETPAADWVVIDADVLGPTKPGWLDDLGDDVYVLGPTDGSVPDWVTETGIPVLDPALARLLSHVATPKIDAQKDDDSPDTATTDPLDRATDAPDASAGGDTAAARSTEGAVRASETGLGDDGRPNDGGRATEHADRSADAGSTAPVLDGIDPLSVVPFPIAFLDGEGVIRLTNRAWAQFEEGNGRLPDETDVGVNYLDTCAEANDNFAVSAAKAIRRVIDGETDSEQVEYPCHGRDTKRWFSMNVVTVDDTEPIAVAVIHYDVSHYKQRINVLDRVLRHNLRNKANIILGHAAALASDREDETATAATTIGAAARELLSLSEQARRYREVSTDDRPTTPVDMVSVVNEVTERLSERHPDAIIETSLPAAAVVRGTQSLSLVVHELVENAIVHNDRSEPWVRVDVGRIHEGGDEWFSLRVVDDGPSIPKQDRRLLTGGLEEHPIRHGSQLGVWVVSSLVTSLEGKVTVEPRSPRGNVVTATFPSVTPES